MREAFRVANQALIDARYQCRPEPWFDMSEIKNIVFGGDMLCLRHFGGDRYSDNGGGGYSAADLSLLPRFANDKVVVCVAKLLKQAFPELVAVVQKFPRSNAQAQEVLRQAADLDRLAQDLIPAATAQVEAEEAAAEQLRVSRNSSYDLDAICRKDLIDEVLRLDDDGLLDDSNALASLKALAIRMRALKGRITL
jgi:hypothetical protein